MTNRIVLPLVFMLAFGCSVAVANRPQSREHLTPQEIDLVKDTQELDKRIDVFVKAAERRVLALNGVDAVSAKQLKKDAEAWGELPSGTRAELIGDIARIFDEAITNIDDLSARDERNPLIPKAIRRLAAATTTILDRLRSSEAQAKNQAEVGNLELLKANADEILQAATKLPPVPEKMSKGEKSKEKH